MRFRMIALGSALFLATGAASATTFDFNLASNAARVGLTQPLTTTGLEVGGGWLHHQDNGEILDAGLHLVNDANPGRGSLKVGLGAKLFYVNFDERGLDDGSSVAIGGKFRYTWPDFNRFAIGGHLYYGPSVTSAGDLKSYGEAAIRAEYLVLRNANAYIGVRRIRVGVDPRDDTETFESGVNAGIRLDF